MSQIRNIHIEDEMRQSYINYAMSVIRGRAIPDVRDGLKPVQRRILYGMDQLSLQFNRPQKKCARIVGEVMGKYHPHGDQAIYDALAHMAQDFSLRYPLIDGQGNFGSIDGDAPAAMRYCVTGDTRIATPNGTLRMDELISGAQAESDNDLDVEVFDHRGKSVRASKLFHSGSHPTLRLRTAQGYALAGTHNHPILCIVKVAGVPLLLWKLLEEIKPGDRVLLARMPQSVEEDLPQRDRQLALLTGAWIAEGFVSPSRAGFNNVDSAYFGEVLEAYDAIVGGPRYVYQRTIASGSLLHELDVQNLERLHHSPLKELVGRSHEKTIPRFVWAASPAFKRTFLQSLFTGDGSSSLLPRSTIQISYSTYSAQLAKEVQLLLLEFSVICRICSYAKGEFKVVITNRRDARLFLRNVGFLGVKQHKLERDLATIPERSRALSHDYVPFIADYIRSDSGSRGIDRDWLQRHNVDRTERWEQGATAILERIASDEVRSVVAPLVDGDYFYAEVESVTDAGVQPVYSLRVDTDDHSFLTNGFISHNTEARLSAISAELLEEIGENTVDFSPNFDDSLEEPQVLPAKLPGLLLNGSWGISVGMTTQIPPHNLGELVDALLYMIDHDDANVEDLMKIVKGPDFPTGGIILGVQGIEEAFRTGRGKMRVRGRASIEDNRIIITEIPFQIRKSTLIETIAEKVKSGLISEISDLRDESNRQGIRVVVELKRGSVAQVALNKLYKYTPLESTFGANFLVIAKNSPRRLSLKQMLQSFLDFRREVVRRRTEHRLAQAEARAHLLEGLLRALENRDEIIKLISKTREPAEALKKLQDKYEFSEAQAEAILQIRLRQFTGLETEKLQEEHKEKQKLIKEYRQILGSAVALDKVIKKELKDIRDQYADPRRTEINPHGQAIGEINLEALIPAQDVAIGITTSGYVNAPREDVFRKQHRGGKGVIAIRLREKDFLKHIFKANTHDHLLIFTSAHKAYKIRGFQLPSLRRDAHGENLRALIEMGDKDEVCAMLTLPLNQVDTLFAATITRSGIVNRNRLKDYVNAHTGGILSLNADEGDFTVQVKLTGGKGDLLLVSERGQTIRFKEELARCTSRPSKGVIGMRMDAKDGLVSFINIEPGEPEDKLLLVTQNGYGKRTPLEEFPKQGRGGKGVLGIKVSKKTGSVVAAVKVKDGDELMVTTRGGKIIRFGVDHVRIVSRYALGVKVIDVDAGDSVASVVRWEADLDKASELSAEDVEANGHSDAAALDEDEDE